MHTTGQDRSRQTTEPVHERRRQPIGEAVAQPEPDGFSPRAFTPKAVKIQSPATLELPDQRDLPPGYEETTITVLVRDPYWLYAYWEISEDALRKASLQTAAKVDRQAAALRIFRLPDSGAGPQLVHELSVGDANDWYINVNQPGAAFVAHLGLTLPDGDFHELARSNPVHTPPDRPSDIVDGEWEVVSRLYQYLARAATHTGASPAMVRIAQQELAPRQFLEMQALSPGLVQTASPLRGRPEKAQGFHLQVHTDLILYGATEPGAQVTVQGAPVEVRPDGSFSLRYTLTNGTLVLPVEATKDQQKMIITPVVRRDTF